MTRILPLAAFACGMVLAIVGDARAQTGFTIANKIPGEVVRAWVTNQQDSGGQEGAIENAPGKPDFTVISNPFATAEGDNIFRVHIRNAAATATYCLFRAKLTWTPTPVVGVLFGGGTYACHIEATVTGPGRTCDSSAESNSSGCNFSFSVR